jgi:hypothetical protein
MASSIGEETKLEVYGSKVERELCMCKKEINEISWRMLLMWNFWYLYGTSTGLDMISSV